MKYFTNKIKRIGVFSIGLVLAKLEMIRRSPRSYTIGAGVVLLIAISVVVMYRILNPVVIVTPDVYPFESTAEYNEFIKKNPLFTANVPEGKSFTKASKIRADKKAVFTIELSQRPLKPDMDERYVQSYISYLESSQKEALDWIKSTGQNPDEIAIIWRPDVEQMRGLLLGESTHGAPINGAGSTPSTSSPTPTPKSSVVPTPSGRFPQ